MNYSHSVLFFGYALIAPQYYSRFDNANREIYAIWLIHKCCAQCRADSECLQRIGTFACRTLHHDTKASKRANFFRPSLTVNSNETLVEEKKKGRLSSLLSWFGKLFVKVMFGLVELVWSKWIMLIINLLFLYGPFVYIQIAINDPSQDTTPFTNIAFAILAGISAVSFSWARAIEQDDKRLVRSIVYSGEVSFQAAIFFIMASAFKYVHLKTFPNETASPFIYFRLVMLWASVILFCIAVLNFSIALSNLCYVLRKRMRLGDNLPSDFQTRIE